MVVALCPSHLFFCLGDKCFLEPYLPRRFVRQFSFDQRYVGNPNPKLNYQANLIDDARSWRQFVTGCSGAMFHMPECTSSLRTSLGYCTWYFASNTEPQDFKINALGIHLIFAKHEGKAKEQAQGKRVRIPRFWNL